MTNPDGSGRATFITRRAILQGVAGGAALVASPHVIRPASAQQRRIVVRDTGGVFTRAFQETLYAPFQKATGIEVVGVAANMDPLAQVKMMVDTRNYTWDAVILGEPAREDLGDAGYLEAHGLENEENVRDIPRDFLSKWGVGSNVSAHVMAYRANAFPAGKAPQSWVDFWNVAGFPARRALFRSPRYILEFALIADGVKPDALFPLDADRAFKSLDRVKPQIAVWWTAFAQATQLMTSQEVDLLSSTASRIQDAVDAGTPMTTVWDGGFWQVDSWCIVKGTPKADLAREFIKFATSAKAQAGFPVYAANGPVHPAAIAMIAPERRKILPTYEENLRKMSHVNTPWWKEHQAALVERFNSWFLG